MTVQCILELLLYDSLEEISGVPPFLGIDFLICSQNFDAGFVARKFMLFFFCDE